jgi:hypothetical protein
LPALSPRQRLIIAHCIVCLGLVSAVPAYGQASVSAFAEIGDHGSDNNLCYQTDFGHLGQQAICSAKVKDGNDGLATGRGGAAAYYGLLELFATAAISSDGAAILDLTPRVHAQFEDSFSVQNLNVPGYFVVTSALASSGSGSVLPTVGLATQLEGNGSAGKCGVKIETNYCTATIPIPAHYQSQVALSISLSGTMTITCGTGCTSAYSDLEAGFRQGTGGGSVLAIFVADANGKPIHGVKVASSSGHSYPGRFASSISLNAQPNPATQGQVVTFTASVKSYARPGDLTGKVVFQEGSTVLGISTLETGDATFLTSGLGAGTHAISATYQGDELSMPAASYPVQQVVN